MKRVSVIVPLYRGQKYTDNLISMLKKNSSSLANSKTELEIIFVNDSPEEEIIVPPLNGVILHTNENNQGIHASRVNGLKLATGEYILMLDQDDIISDHYIQSQLSHMADNDAVICNGYYRDKKTIFPEAEVPNMTKDVVYSSRNRIISPGQVLLRKESIPVEWTGMIMKTNAADDFFLWILMAAENKRFAYNPQHLFLHVEGHGNTSDNWEGMIESLEEMLNYVRDSEKLSDDEFETLKKNVGRSIHKHTLYVELERGWKNIYRSGKTLGSYFKHKESCTVGIYGYGVIGKRVLDELQADRIRISYIVDQDSDDFHGEIPVYRPDDHLPYVDILIVTPLFAYESIAKKMKEKSIGEIISIHEIVQEVLMGE